MKLLPNILLFFALAGCEAMYRVAPQTSAGFEAGGVLGALDGASGAILARCRTLDGALIRVAIDDVATLTSGTDAVARVREARKAACARAAAVAFVVDVAEGGVDETPIDE